jgi:hypothetical protein
VVLERPTIFPRENPPLSRNQEGTREVTFQDDKSFVGMEEYHLRLLWQVVMLIHSDLFSVRFFSGPSLPPNLVRS